MLLLRQLFAVAGIIIYSLNFFIQILIEFVILNISGGGQETDAFKHLAAAFTVLRSLGSAKTSSNSESSRIGKFIEVQVTDRHLYRFL